MLPKAHGRARQSKKYVPPMQFVISLARSHTHAEARAARCTSDEGELDDGATSEV